MYETTFEAHVMQNEEWVPFSKGHETPEEAYKHARLSGWDKDKIYIIRKSVYREKVYVSNSW